ncbi:hypothetical protein PITCH_A760003 [uncultured Desulfobacterium sp.]|uniref:Uncharacterized protein n=1 Tax=uncultured Desulfobacterium sp. TaxID=201089 RepID=A0A445N264_9BACT|nr:hypothetical protein PITCH_A760003 [uncultured Desulfobacterium sp.]
MMSKILKRKKHTTSDAGEKGAINIAREKPETSSITTSDGSFLSKSFWVSPEDQTEIAMKIAIVSTLCHNSSMFKKSMNGKAATEPTVPDAAGKSPMPNHVDRIMAAFPKGPAFLNT